MRGVIYARYSPGPHQTEQSIEGQVADCQQYAEEHGIDIIEIYADRKVSGKSVVGRDEFQRSPRDGTRTPKIIVLRDYVVLRIAV